MPFYPRRPPTFEAVGWWSGQKRAWPLLKSPTSTYIWVLFVCLFLSWVPFYSRHPPTFEAYGLAPQWVLDLRLRVRLFFSFFSSASHFILEIHRRFSLLGCVSSFSRRAPGSSTGHLPPLHLSFFVLFYFVGVWVSFRSWHPPKSEARGLVPVLFPEECLAPHRVLDVHLRVSRVGLGVI